MIQILVIAAMIAINMAASRSWHAPLELRAWVMAMLTLALPAAGWLVAHVACVALGRAMDRRGDRRAPFMADRITSWYRSGVCVWLGGTAIALGWAGALARVIGSEFAALAIGATLLAGCLWASWWSLGPIDRRVRESALIRRLDQGQPIWEIAGAARFATARLRDGVLMVMLPVLVLVGASSLLAAAGRGAAASLRADGGGAPLAPTWLTSDDSPMGLASLLQILGFVGALALMPMLQRRIWDTVPLGPGPMREWIERLCRAGGTRLRRILVWRTRGMSVNAAVLGALPRFRYLIFTDALLESMPAEQVGAVAAHEIGHLRHHHVIWLIAGAGGVLMLGGEAGARAALLAGLGESAAEVCGLIGAAVVGLPVLGFVSRRFEWQADAYATALLARAGLGARNAAPAFDAMRFDDQEFGGRTHHGARTVSDTSQPLAPASAAASSPPPPPLVIDADSARAVSAALGNAAALNGADPRAFSWRHGSIASRRRRVERLAGQRIDALPQDRAARAVKAMIVGGWLVVGWLLVRGGA